MRRKNTILKIAALFTAFILGTSCLTFFKNVNPTRLEATPYLEDYEPYYYNGSYYSSIDFSANTGMNGELRQSLTTLIKPKGFYTYGGNGTTHLSTQLQYADEDPNNSSNMIYLYTRNSVQKSNGTVNNTVIWTREHVWPQSLSNDNWGETEGGTDILHLRPTYHDVNSSRGNKPYGNTNKATAKYYDGMLYGYTTTKYFEPIDQVKGDVARIIMYLWTTYTGYSGYNSLNILDVFDSYNTLLSWHTMDKPDALEGNRNDYAQASKQKNRNPFVDHPELAWKIFGDNASTSVKNACISAYPDTSSGDPIAPTGITMNKSTASVEVGKSLQLSASLKPNGATGTIVWSSTNSSVASVTNGLVTANATGNATITASVSGTNYSASCAVTVTAAVNNYGSLNNPLSVDDAIEVISITGSSLTSEPLYVKGIVSSNTAFNTQYSNYNAVWLKSDDGKTAQALQLYRAILDSNVEGEYTNANTMKDLEIVAYGYAKYYNDTTYELCTASSNPKNPTILSIDYPGATAITLNKSDIELTVGNTFTLTASLTPSNSHSTYTWISSNTSVATVSDGIVTGVATGEAIITAKVNNEVTAECAVTVVSSSQAGETVTITLNYVDMTTGGVTETAGSQTFNKNGLTFIISNGVANSNYSDVRVYKGATITFSAINITSIAFTCSSGNPASNFSSFDGFDNNTGVWAGSSASVSFTASAAQVRITKIVIAYVASEPIQQEDSPDDFLTDTETYATVSARELGTYSPNITIADQGFENKDKVASLVIDSKVSATFDKGTSNTDPAYYDTGAGVRVYGGNTFTIYSDIASVRIIRVEFGIAAGASSATSLAVSSKNLIENAWSGETNSVTFTNTDSSGHVRISSIKVTYYENEQAYSIGSVAMRFGVSITKAKWDAINNDSRWEITDYGVMMVKQSTLTTYGEASVEDAYRHGKNVTISNKLKNSDYDDPYLLSGVYSFTVKLSSIPSTDYNTTVCAVPYIVVKDEQNHEEYYFLTEIRKSVKDLASYYRTNGGSSLSNKALDILTA